MSVLESGVMEEVPGSTRESARKSAAERVPELDGLRGVAVLVVVISHYLGVVTITSNPPWLQKFLWSLRIGWSGVDLFFVLSGFLIGGILLDARESKTYYKTFYMRRVFRILPVYYLWIALFMAVTCALQLSDAGRRTAGIAELWVLPKLLLFGQNIFNDWTAYQWKWFVVTWSLAVEEQFYLIAPLLLRKLDVKRVAWLMGGVLLAAPALRLAVFYGPPKWSALATVAMPCRADSLACGILLAIAWRTPGVREWIAARTSWLWASFGLLLCGAAAIAKQLCLLPESWVKISIGYTWLGLLFSVTVWIGLTQKRSWLAGVMRWKALRALGTISYCVYIIHMSVNYYAHELLLKRTKPEIYGLETYAVTLLALGVTLGLATASWYWFEKPMLRRGHRYAY